MPHGDTSLPGTSTPEANTALQLYEAAPGTDAYRVVQNGTTDAMGNYSFTVEGVTNELYQVRTATTPVQHTAVVFQGVQDALTLSSSAQTSTVDGSVTLSGNVAPDKTGEPVYLQKLGADGQWHTVKTSKVTAGSQYSFSWTFASAGTKEFRARILGDGTNVGGASAAASVMVSQPSLSQLPTG